jgi:hypothetical protein
VALTWADHVRHIDKARSCYKIYSEVPFGKRPLVVIKCDDNELTAKEPVK